MAPHCFVGNQIRKCDVPVGHPKRMHFFQVNANLFFSPRTPTARPEVLFWVGFRVVGGRHEEVFGPKCQTYGLNGGGCSLEIFNSPCMSLVYVLSV